MKKISVIIPMYYEELVAEECHKRMTNVLKSIDNYEYEIIYVNDGSKDKTLEILEEIAKNDENSKIVSFSRESNIPSHPIMMKSLFLFSLINVIVGLDIKT